MIQIEGEVKDFSLHKRILSDLLSFFYEEPKYFLITSDILLRYSELGEMEQDDFAVSKKDYERDYPTILQHDSETFFECIEQIYQLDYSAFTKFRGDITEYILTHVGPKENEFIDSSCLHEVQLKEGNTYIGTVNQTEPGKNMDICFYEKQEFSVQESVSCELYECKIDLRNFIPLKELQKAKYAKKIEKIKYMEALRRRFLHNSKFQVAFATFAMNLKRQKKSLEYLQCEHLHIVNKNDIYRMLQREKKREEERMA